MQDSKGKTKNTSGHGKPVVKNHQFSVMHKLRNRELFGVCCRRYPRTYAYCAIPHIKDDGSLSFTVPSHLSVNLSSLVSYDILYLDGHVFLGFSSCGQFLLSYTSNVEPHDSGSASHTYFLHWWLFNGKKKLKLVGSSRLFSTEEIDFPICIHYVEWPNFKSQIVVFGWEHVWCECRYVTIVAVPSVHPCAQCKSCENELPTDNTSNMKARCLSHGFLAHFEQMPYDEVVQPTSLNIDGVLVLNLSHSIAVVSAGLADEYDGRRKLGQGLRKVENKKECSNSEKLLVFSEKFYEADSNENIAVEEIDDIECSYCVMHVQGRGGEVLRPTTQGRGSCEAFSQRLILDMEQVIFNVLKNEYSDAHKYGRLLMYDINITDVFPESFSVLIHSALLIGMPARPQNPPATYQSFSNEKICYQAEFYLLWHLETGRYETVFAAPMEIWEERNRRWDGAEIIQEHDGFLRRKFAAPSNVHSSVYYLSNAAVLHGKSLETLWNSDKTFAITL